MLTNLLLLAILIALALLLLDIRAIRHAVLQYYFPCFGEDVLKARARQRDAAFASAEATKWTDEQWEASTITARAEMAVRRYVASTKWQQECAVLSFMRRANFEVRVGKRSPDDVTNEQNSRTNRACLDALVITRYQELLRKAVLDDRPIPEAPALAWDLVITNLTVTPQ